jgi:hypothetical protein
MVVDEDHLLDRLSEFFTSFIARVPGDTMQHEQRLGNSSPIFLQNLRPYFMQGHMIWIVVHRLRVQLIVRQGHQTR